ncbi:MAG: ATP-binding protein, partial [Thermodesulfobacteriota bacterium]|nr:ATP-binding protein [Thermodesulfobacteriota bacterium]
MRNPFQISTLALGSSFCNRVKELDLLTQQAFSGANVVLYSPRRYGKTSLVRKVQAQLSQQGVITIFVDFFGVDSVDEVAARLARAVFAVTRQKESRWKTAIRIIRGFRPILKPNEDGSFSLSVEATSASLNGLDLLQETMVSIEDFFEQSEETVHLCLDEFQEIVSLPDSFKIEAIMRSQIQKQNASWFFVGSRRRVLLAMFNERKRPFFQSAFNYELKLLPRDEFAEFIAQQFEQSGKKCPLPVAEVIVDRVQQHPLYTQKLAHITFNRSGTTISPEDVAEAFLELCERDRPIFEAMLQGLSLQQI